MAKQDLLSVVVPCYNEELVIREMSRKLVAALEKIPDIDFEVIYVDDGSEDATLAILRELQQADARVRALALSRRFYQHTALTAGISEAAGDAVVIIDADLQDPPEIIAPMVERWRQGVDVIHGHRPERAGDSAFKRWTSKVFHHLINLISDTPIPLDTGEFRLMDRKAVDAFLAMPERDRFLRGMMAWIGFHQEAIEFRRAPRAAGTTKYSVRQMFHVAFDGILSFSFAPLRLAIWLGFLASALALGGIFYALFIRLFTDAWVAGWALLFIASLFLGGVQLLLIGVLGEYLGRIYMEVKRRPLYLVRERLGFPPREQPPQPPREQPRRP